MKPRYFHLYADYKTVKELDSETYRNFPRNHMTVSVRKDGLWLRKKDNYIWLPRVQLEKILGEG